MVGAPIALYALSSLALSAQLPTRFLMSCGLLPFRAHCNNAIVRVVFSDQAESRADELVSDHLNFQCAREPHPADG
ncbi:hypothetical protein BC567DRAFT_234728 [Phyllosticta citribraziliensis]